MQLRNRKIYKHGNSHYTLLDSKIIKEYDLRKGQSLERVIDLHEDGFSINYRILQSTILERDTEIIKKLLASNINMPLHSLYIQFNPSKANKEYMQGRCKAAYEAVRRDSE